MSGKTKPGKLAICGGTPAVSIPHPHYVWPPREESIAHRIAEEYLTGPLSVSGREGPILAFEDSFAKYHDTPYALSTSSGTAALHTAFFSLGLKQGDEVLVPVYTYHASVTPLLHLGVKPIFCDVDPDTGTLNPDEIAKRVTDRTGAIIVTHMWGHPCDMDAICFWANEFQLPIIEDCSHAHGASYKRKLVGTFGKIACWSLQASKILPAGEGGILLTNDRDVYEKATLLGHWGKRAETELVNPKYRQYARTGLGLKLRMHPLAAVIALESMKNLDTWIANRATLLGELANGLDAIPGICPPSTRPHVTRGAWYGFLCRASSRFLDGIPLELFVKALVAEGVEARIPGTTLLTHLPLFQPPSLQCLLQQAALSAPCSSLYSGAEEFVRNTFQLPTFTALSDRSIIEEYLSAIHKVVLCRDELAAVAQSSR